MRLLILILLFILIFISQINTIVDIDLWWNLKTGEYIVKNFKIPRIDIFSYTLEKRPWIDHEWLSQVLLYVLFSRLGWPGLNLIKAFIISLCFFILIFLVFSKYKKTTFAVFFILISVLAFGYRSFLRPELFSYLLLCVFFYILEKQKRLYTLPFLQILWVNLHGYFILGPAIVFLYSLGEFLSGERTKAKGLGIILIFTVLACFMNPYFYKGAAYPIRVLLDVFTGQKIWMQNVQELKMPINSSFEKYIFFWALAILSSVTFLVNLKNVRIKHILTFAVFFIAAYSAVRNAPFFIFVAAPLASMNMNEAALTKNIPDRRCHAVFAVIILTLIYFFTSNEYYRFTNQFPFKKTESRFSQVLMPRGACDFLEKNNIQGRIFNTLDFGPYIGYRFYPEKRILIDTRTDLYKDDFYELYRKAQNYPREWREMHERYRFDIVLLRHLFGGTERALKYLYKNDGWKLVYYDENSALFLSNVARYKDIIARYEIDFSKKVINESDASLSIAMFFEKIDETQLAEKIYIKLLEDNPRFLEAGNNLAAIYIKSGRPQEALKLIERFLAYYPKTAELYANAGTAYLRMGKRGLGISMLERSARLNPYLRRASYMLGLVYLERGEIDRAKRQFEKYLRLDPFDAEVHRILGDIYMEKGLSENARLEYNEADALEGK